MKNNATTTQTHQATGKKRGAATIDDTLVDSPIVQTASVGLAPVTAPALSAAQAADLPGNTTRVGDKGRRVGGC